MICNVWHGQERRPDIHVDEDDKGERHRLVSRWCENHHREMDRVHAVQTKLLFRTDTFRPSLHPVSDLAYIQYHAWNSPQSIKSSSVLQSQSRTSHSTAGITGAPSFHPARLPEEPLQPAAVWSTKQNKRRRVTRGRIRQDGGSVASDTSFLSRRE